MAKALSKLELGKLERLFDRLTPDEAALLTGARDRIAKLPPEKQRELGRAVAKFLHNRGTN